MTKISFETNPKNYLHWSIEIRENLAFLTMNVNEECFNSFCLLIDFNVEYFPSLERHITIR